MSLWNWITNPRKNIKNRVADVKDRLSVSAAAIGQSATGFFSGGSAYNNLRSSAQSFYVRELLDTRLTKSQFKAMHKSSKRFNKYADTKKITALFKRYSDDPKRLADQSSRLMKKALGELEVFTKNYTSLIQIIRDELLKEKQFVSVENNYLNMVFGQLWEAQRRKQVYFPPELLKEAQTVLGAAIREQLVHLDFDLNEDQKVKNDVRISRGGLARVFSFWSGYNYWGNKTKKFVKKLKRAEDKEFKTNLLALKVELDSGNISPATLARIVRHVKSFKRSQEYLKEISHDSRALLSEADILASELIGSNMKFLATFRASPEVNDAMRLLDQLRKDHALALSVAQADTSDVQKLRDYLSQINKNLSIYFNMLFRLSEQSLNTLKAQANQNQPLEVNL